MLRNNADARPCSYFELGLPVFMLKHFAHRPNSKNNGPVLFLILGVELNCFLMSIATNGKERHGLKREEFAPPFQL